MSPTATGRKAEAVAAAFLEYKGCAILARNWRTRRCEIDIVAKRDNIVYFCEVKYRKQHRQGSGVEYVTPKKIVQMKFAAECWIAANYWPGSCELCVIEVAGAQFAITGVFKNVM